MNLNFHVIDTKKDDEEEYVNVGKEIREKEDTYKLKFMACARFNVIW